MLSQALADPDVAYGETGPFGQPAGGQGLKQFELVGDGGELVQVARDLVEPVTQLVGVRPARLGAHLANLGGGGVEEVTYGGRLGALFGYPLFDQVPVVLERRGQRPQSLGLHAAGKQQQQGPGQVGGGQELVLEGRPALLGRHRRTDLIEHLHPRRQSRLQRELAEQTPGEGMQGPDGGAVELVQGHPATLRLWTVPWCASAWRSISRRARSRSSSAALSVKVMAAIERSSASPVVTSATMRSTRAVVLPDPAPASTNRVERRSDRMRAGGLGRP